MLLQAHPDIVDQVPLAPFLPPPAQHSLAVSHVHRPAINQQELISVTAPNDDSKIDFWVPSCTQPATVSIEASPVYILSSNSQSASCAEVFQPVWTPARIPSQLAVASQTVRLRQISNSPPPAQPVSTSATICTQPLRELASFLLGFPWSSACPADSHSSAGGCLAAAGNTKKAQSCGGLTFCGQPNKVACWLAGLCDYVPGRPMSESHLWAVGTGLHFHSAVRLAGLQQLGRRGSCSRPSSSAALE